MATFTDSATIEKSSAFEDAACDPDLEARLYAEIYYSNETYQQDPSSHVESSRNPETSAPSAGEVGEFPSNRENVQNAGVNIGAQTLESLVNSEALCPGTSWIQGEGRQDNGRDFPLRNVSFKHPKRQRLLAHEGLWRPRAEQQVTRTFNEAATLGNKDSVQGERPFEAERFASASYGYTGAKCSQLAVNCFENNYTRFGGNSSEARSLMPGANWFEEAGNAIGSFGSNLTEARNFTPCVNLPNDSRIASARFRDHVTNPKNIPTHITQFQKARSPSTSFIDPITGLGKIAPVASSSNQVRNVFEQSERNLIEVQSLGPRLACLNKTADTSTQSGSNLNEAEPFTPITAGWSEARSIFGRFESGLANTSENEALTDEAVIHDYSQLLEDPLSEPRNRIKRSRQQRKANWRQFLAEKKMRKKTRKRFMDTASDATANSDAATSNESSKYNVVAKETKLNTQETTSEPVSISSDSDDSILEVPVPPKAPPPLIQLQDSDDEFEVIKSFESPLKRGEKMVEEPRNIETESSEDEATHGDDDNGKSAESVELLGGCAESSKNDESPASPIREACPADLQRILRESAKKFRNSEVPDANLDVHSQELCEDDSGRSSKSRPKKSKKSAESVEISAVPIEDCEDSTKNDDSPASPIREACPADLQRISRESAKKSKNSETPKRAKKSAESMENSAESAASFKNDESAKKSKNSETPKRVKKLSGSVEKSADPVEVSVESADSFRKDELPTTPTTSGSLTNSQKIQRESAKKSRSLETPKRSKKSVESAEKIAESLEKSTESVEKSTESSESFMINESPASPIDDSPTNLQEILRESAKRAKSTTVPVKISMPDDNLILNCTQVQRGASSLNEIRMMRETVALNHAYSDDNMTENEASNWANIEAGQSNASRTEVETSSIDLSSDHTNLWEQLSSENRPTSFTEVMAGTSAENLPIRTIVTTEATLNNDAANSDVGYARKRSKDTASSTFDDFDVPAVPEKRAKHCKQKTSREQTMSEYFFKPMSKELVAFYNNPCGGENLDVCDIQNRMPRNPNRWAILDADLQGPVSRRRRKMCPRCKMEMHFGKKCTEKPKTPCCYMCGATGHTESRCPHTMCLTCGRKYATYRPTCDHCSKLFCSMCNGAGHSCENCPDLWRRYHNTTTETMPVTPRDTATVMKPTHNLSCCNCARRGHDMTTCRQLRWTQHFPTPMKITSYTEGPTYAPTDPITVDETPEAPQCRQYYETDVDSPPVHEASQDQGSTNSNFNEIIEIIEVLDDSTSSEPAIPPENPLPESRVIFQAGELDKVKKADWVNVTQLLDPTQGIELTGLLSGSLTPDFLLVWQNYFEFHVEIRQETCGDVYATIGLPKKSLLNRLQKVVWQWLQRSDSEKAYLVYDKLSYEYLAVTNEELQTKITLTRTVLNPVTLLRKIAMNDRSLRQTQANLKQTLTKKNRRRLRALRMTAIMSMNRRSQLVTSLYCGFWVDKKNKLLPIFRQLAGDYAKNLCIGKPLNIRDYLLLVHSYNELFTFHENETLRKALEKAIAAALQAERSEALPPSEALVFPKAELPINMDIIGLSDVAKTRRPLTVEKAVGGAAANGVAIASGAADTLAGSLFVMAKSSDASDPEPAAANEPRILNDCARDGEMAQAHGGEKSQSAQQQQQQNVSAFLSSYTKKQRKVFLRTARQLIRVAKLSNVLQLQEMAKIVRHKCDIQTATTCDLDWLRKAMRKNMRLRNETNSGGNAAGGPKPFKGTGNVRQDDERKRYDRALDPTYVKFLRTL